VLISEQEIDPNRVKLSTKEDELERLREQLAGKGQTIEEQSQRIRELQEELRESQNKHRRQGTGQQEGSIEHGLADRIRELELMLASKEASLDELNSFLEEDLMKLARLEGDCNNLEAENRDLRTQQDSDLQRVLADHRQLSLENSSLKEQLAKCREQQTLAEEAREQTSQKMIGEAGSMETLIFDLRLKLQDLEETIKAKDTTIMELSEFMNEQALRLADCEAIILNGQEGESRLHVEKVEELEQILKSKEGSIGEMTEFLQQSLCKIGHLEG
jgi:uncharacterized coiled-coil protein SlyX